MTRSFIIIGYFLLLSFACSRSGKEGNHASGKMGKVHDAMILKAEKKPIEISLPADILPLESAKIFSKVNGFIKTMQVDIGSRVRKGEILAIIEAPELKAQLSEARFKRDASKARFLASKDTYERIKESSGTPGVISMNDLEKSKNQMISDSSNFTASQFYFSSIQDLNNYLQIISPFDGTITIRNLNIGDIVGPGSAKPIFELENNKTLRIRIAVPESMTGNVLVSEHASFAVSAYPGRIFSSHFARKAGSVDFATRSEIWEFETDNTAQFLKAGMYAELKLLLTRTEPSFYVPNTAIVTSLERSFIIRVKNSKSEWIDVSKGNSVIDKIEVFGKLAEMDTILINSNEEIKPGLLIKSKIP